MGGGALCGEIWRPRHLQGGLGWLPLVFLFLDIRPGRPRFVYYLHPHRTQSDVCRSSSPGFGNQALRSHILLVHRRSHLFVLVT